MLKSKRRKKLEWLKESSYSTKEKMVMKEHKKQNKRKEKVVKMVRHNSLSIPPKETMLFEKKASRPTRTAMTLKERLAMMPKPPPAKFELEQTIKVHNKVCDGCSAVICGMEYGPYNHKLKQAGEGWVYYLRFAGQTLADRFTASEEEIIKWQEGKK